MQYLLATSSPHLSCTPTTAGRDEQFSPSRADPAFPRRPGELGDKAWEYFEDGLLWIEHGHVRALDHAAYLLPQLPADLPLEEHPQRLLPPGFIDCHVHYPQLE